MLSNGAGALRAVCVRWGHGRVLEEIWFSQAIREQNAVVGQTLSDPLSADTVLMWSKYEDGGAGGLQCLKSGWRSTSQAGHENASSLADHRSKVSIFCCIFGQAYPCGLARLPI